MTKKKVEQEELTDAKLSQITKKVYGLYRTRKHLIKAQTKITNQLAAITRGIEGTKQGTPVSKAIVKKTIEEHPNFTDAGGVLGPLAAARALIHKHKNEVELAIKHEVRRLPIWTEWAINVRGVAELTIGIIVGGSHTEKDYVTIGDYNNPAKLWKRWGLAVIDGERQRRIKASKEEIKLFDDTGVSTGNHLKAIDHGFSPTRRAEVYVFGENFNKAVESEEVDGKKVITHKYYYRRRIDEEKARLRGLYPEAIPAKAGGKKANKYTDGHLLNMAKRKATKGFLADVWNKWREFHGGEHRRIGERA